MIRNKRKGDHISDDNTALGTTTITYSTNINNWLLKLLLVFDQIKRFRISYTPGITITCIINITSITLYY